MTRRAIQRAMDVSGLAAGDIAYEGARRILEQHEGMALTAADRKAFYTALEKPPASTARLIAALERHSEHVD
jgi:uncharacterized protein (DUF1778 family)